MTAQTSQYVLTKPYTTSTINRVLISTFCGRAKSHAHEKNNQTVICNI